MWLGWKLPRSHSLAVLALQQAPVGVDFALQPGPDVQQHLVLLVLPLQVSPDLRQLLLHGADQALHLGQLGAVAGLGLTQGVLQTVLLWWEIVGRESQGTKNSAVKITAELTRQEAKSKQSPGIPRALEKSLPG